MFLICLPKWIPNLYITIYDARCSKLDTQCILHICFVHETWMLYIKCWILIALFYIQKTIYSENHRSWMEICKTNSLVSFYIYCVRVYVYTGVFWQLCFVHIHIIMATMATAPTLIFNKQQCVCIQSIYLLYFIFHVIVRIFGMRKCILGELGLFSTSFLFIVVVLSMIHGTSAQKQELQSLD